MVGKIYEGILEDIVHGVTGGLIDDCQRGSREEKRCVDQNFTLKQIGEKKCSMHVGLIDFENAYNRVNREAL